MAMLKKNTWEKSADQLLISAKRHSNALAERLLEVFALYNLSKNLNITLYSDNIFAEVEGLLMDSLRISDFSIMLLDEKGEALTVWKANQGTYEATKKVSFKVGEGISGLVVKGKKPILVQNVREDKRFLHYKGKKTTIGSFYSTPLQTKQAGIMGVLNIHKPEIKGFKESDLMVFNEAASHISQALENSKIFQNTRKQAITDELTQLHSRRFFMEALDKEISNALRHQGVFSIIMVDVDHFKPINDTYGHLVGDNILKRLAEIMKNYIRQGDTLARYGGEEFILLLPGIGKAETSVVAEKLRSQVEKSLTIDCENGPPENVTISAGIASFPQSGESMTDIIGCADKYLYYAKRTGRNKVCYSIEEDSLSRKKSEEKRVEKRLPISLKVAKKLSEVQYIEMSLNGKWIMCVVSDICQKGFKGSVEFEPEAGLECQCKLVSPSAMVTQDSFSARIMHSNKTKKRYSIGVEVFDNMKVWNEFYYILTH